MGLHRIKRGYDIPFRGKPEQVLFEASLPEKFGIQPNQFRGLKPKLNVQLNDRVKKGTPLFVDKKNTDISFCSPVSGKISEINYGARRKINTIQITRSGDDVVQHKNYRFEEIVKIKRGELIEHLLKGGLWPYIRQRPFNKIADPKKEPSSIFVNCMDTGPPANDPEFSLRGKFADFRAGIEALKVIGNDKVHVVANGKNKSSEFLKVEGVTKHSVIGKHPAGCVGTHISLIDPVIKAGKSVWYLKASDVVNFGSFLLGGQYPAERVIVIGGEGVAKPGYYKTVAGFQVDKLINALLVEEIPRIISGNILTGHRIELDEYLGFYDDVITIIPEDCERKFIAWMLPGLNRPTFSRTFLSSFLPGRKLRLTTNLNGEYRMLVKTGDYRKVTALDVLPDFMVKAIFAEDIDRMEELGILECDPEDFALCSYICPSKTEFTEIIRHGLDLMEQEIG